MGIYRFNTEEETIELSLAPDVKKYILSQLQFVITPALRVFDTLGVMS